MKRIAGIVLALSLLPIGASALTSTSDLLKQIQALKQQLANLQGQTSCDLPTKALRRGSSGIEVTRLQEFLARDPSIFPETSVSGYYGALTEAAVQRWQIKNNVVTSGTAATTGFGAVGPKTLGAMRPVWCLQSILKPAPFTPPFVPATTSSTTVSTKPAVPQIVFTSPTASSTVNKGGTILVSWQSTLAPSGASVVLSLRNKNGVALGVIKSNLTSIGSFFWTVPAAPKANTGSCSGTTIECLAQIAQTQADCGSFCSIEDGAYKFYAQLMNGAREIAHADSRIFAIGAATLSAADIASTGTTWNFTGNTSSSSSYADNFLNNTNWSQTATAVPGQSCLYSGIPYSDGITLEINCADVTVPGQGCGSYGGMKLSCKNGIWLDSNGVAQSVRNVTTTNTVGSCTTPWGSTIVGNGKEVPYEPFFSNGQYITTGPMKIMKCSSGAWQMCDTVGANCR